MGSTDTCSAGAQTWNRALIQRRAGRSLPVIIWGDRVRSRVRGRRRTVQTGGRRTGHQPRRYALAGICARAALRRKLK
eukprot:23829-Hanusia_phi.AAC.1